MCNLRVFKIKIKNHFKLYLCILLSLFSLLPNIRMKIKNHSNLTILSTFKYKNRSLQIIKNKNKNKIFILISHGSFPCAKHDLSVF